METGEEEEKDKDNARIKSEEAATTTTNNNNNSEKPEGLMDNEKQQSMKDLMQVEREEEEIPSFSCVRERSANRSVSERVEEVPVQAKLFGVRFDNSSVRPRKRTRSVKR